MNALNVLSARASSPQNPETGYSELEKGQSNSEIAGIDFAAIFSGWLAQFSGQGQEPRLQNTDPAGKDAKTGKNVMMETTMLRQAAMFPAMTMSFEALRTGKAVEQLLGMPSPESDLDLYKSVIANLLEEMSGEIREVSQSNVKPQSDLMSERYRVLASLLGEPFGANGKPNVQMMSGINPIKEINETSNFDIAESDVASVTPKNLQAIDQTIDRNALSYAGQISKLSENTVENTNEESVENQASQLKMLLKSSLNPKVGVERQSAGSPVSPDISNLKRDGKNPVAEMSASYPLDDPYSPDSIINRKDNLKENPAGDLQRDQRLGLSIIQDNAPLINPATEAGQFTANLRLKKNPYETKREAYELKGKSDQFVLAPIPDVKQVLTNPASAEVVGYNRAGSSETLIAQMQDGMDPAVGTIPQITEIDPNAKAPSFVALVPNYNEQSTTENSEIALLTSEGLNKKAITPQDTVKPQTEKQMVTVSEQLRPGTMETDTADKNEPVSGQVVSAKLGQSGSNSSQANGLDGNIEINESKKVGQVSNPNQASAQGENLEINERTAVNQQSNSSQANHQGENGRNSKSKETIEAKELKPVQSEATETAEDNITFGIQLQTQGVQPTTSKTDRLEQPVWTQIANEILEKALPNRPQIRELDIQLHPAELGQIRIALVWEDGRVHLRINAAEMQTGQVLQAHLPELRENLSQLGISCGMLEMGMNNSNHSRQNAREEALSKRKNQQGESQNLTGIEQDESTNSFAPRLLDGTLNRINVTA